MKYILIIFLLLCSWYVCAQTNQGTEISDQPQIVGYKATSTYAYVPSGSPETAPIGGVYTAKPRVDNGYYCLDVFVVRFDNWKSDIPHYMDYSGKRPKQLYTEDALGGFTLTMIRKDYSKSFLDIFESPEFTLNPDINNIDPTSHPEYDPSDPDWSMEYVKPLVKYVSSDGTPNPSMTDGGINVSYTLNLEKNYLEENYCPYPWVLELNTPMFVGTLRLKIKNPSERANVVVIPNGSVAAACAMNEELADKPVLYGIVGWLDKDPDIPLDGQDKPTKLDAPELPTIDLAECIGDSTKYKLLKTPADGVTAVWYVSTAPKGTADASIAKINTTNRGEYAGIKWLKAGTYYINVYNQKDTQFSDTVVSAAVTVHAPEVLAVTATPEEVCPGTEVNLRITTTGVTGPYTWTPLADLTDQTNITSSVNVLPKKSTEYTVTATDRNGCKASGSAAVTMLERPKASLEVDADNFIKGQTIYVDLTLPGAESNYNVNWLNPKGTTGTHLEIEGASEDAYNFVVEITEKNKCDTTINVSIARDLSKLGLSVDLVSLYGGVSCKDGMAILTARVTQKEQNAYDLKYEWFSKREGVLYPLTTTTRKADSMIYAAGPGRGSNYYFVKVTNAAVGLVATDSTLVLGRDDLQAPVVDAGGDMTVASGAATVLDGKVVSGNAEGWYWGPVTGIASGANTANPLTKGLRNSTRYGVYIVQGVNDGSSKVQCVSNIDSVSVDVDAAKGLKLDVTPAAALDLCQGSSAQLNIQVANGSGDYTYLWSTTSTSVPELDNVNIANPVFKGATAGQQVYTVLVTDNVTRLQAMQKVILNVSDKEAPVLAVKGDLPHCAGDSLKLTYTSETKPAFVWEVKKDGVPVTVGNSEFYKLSKGEYEVKVVASVGGCASDTLKENLSIDELQLNWKVKPQDLYVNGQTLKAEIEVVSGGQHPFTYHWNAPRPGADSVLVADGVKGALCEFSVTVTSSGNRCSATKTTTVRRDGNKGLEIASESVYGNKICKNGGAVLKTEVVSGGVAPYTFRWFEKGNNTPVKEYVGVNNEMSDMFYVGGSVLEYVVKVTDSNSPALSLYDTIRLEQDAGKTAPVVVAGQDITVYAGHSAALIATCTPEGYHTWNWGPMSGLSSPLEASKQFAKTSPALTKDTKFGVYAVDANNCVSNSDSVEVFIITDESNAFAVKIDPEDKNGLCLQNKQKLDAQVVGGVAAEPLVYAWTVIDPEGKSVSLSAVKEPELLLGKQGDYKVAVTVTDHRGLVASARTILTVGVQTAPQLAFTNTDPKCLFTNIEVNRLATVSAYQWFIDGTEMGATGNSCLVTNEGTVNVKVTAKANNKCPVDTIEGTFTVYPRPLLGWTTDPGSSVKNGDALTMGVELTATTVENYKYKWNIVSPAGATAIPETSTTYSVASADIVESPYKGNIYVEDGNGCHSDTLQWNVDVTAGDLRITADARHGKAICKDAWAILEVTNVQGAIGNPDYTYQWYYTPASGSIDDTTAADRIAGANGTILILKDITAATKLNYTVVVNMKDGSMGGHKNIQLSYKEVADNVPMVDAGEDQTIYPGTSTVLNGVIVTKGLGENVYQWEPADRLKNEAQAHIASPETKALSADQIYSLYVVDENSCVSNIDSVKITTDADKGIDLSIPKDSVIICQGNKIRLQALIGNGSEGVTFNWELKFGDPSLGSLSATNIADPVFTSVPGVIGTHEYLVTATKNGIKASAKVYVTVTNTSDNPVLSWADPDKTEACFGEVITVECKNTGIAGTNVPDGNYQWFVDGVELSNHTSKCNIRVEGLSRVQVIGTGENHCISDTASTEIKFKPFPKLEKFIVSDSCGGTRIVAVSPESDVTYTWTSTPNGTKVSDTVYTIAQSANLFLNYTVKLHLGTSSSEKCPMDTVISGKMYSLPVVTLQPSDKPYSGYPGEVVTIRASGNNLISQYKLVWSPADSLWATSTGGAIGTQNRVTVYTKPLVQDEKIILKTSNMIQLACSRFDTVDITVDALPLYVKLKKDGGADLCQGTEQAELVLDFTGSNMNAVEGPVKVEYTFVPAEGGTKITSAATLNKTDIHQDTVLLKAAEGLGTYEIVNVYDMGKSKPTPGVVQGTVEENTIKVFQKPQVAVDPRLLAVARDSVAAVSVKEPQNTNSYTWSSPTNSSYELDASGYKLSATMADADMTFVLKAEDKTSHCWNTDTANVYRLPDAPKIEIDTNTNRHNIKVKIETVVGADNYTVWSRKWDPYCLLATDGGVYHTEPTGTNLTSLDWAEPDMDTLEFYYVTANRTIPGLGTVNSLPSDTVGYKQDDLHVQPAGIEKTSNNPISWMFDMKYIKETSDILEWYGNENLASVASWVMKDQAMTASTTRNSDWDDMIGMGMTEEELIEGGMTPYYGSVPITLGEVYELSARSELTILQFGKLPVRFAYTFESNSDLEKTNGNIVALPFHKPVFNETTALFDDLTTDVINVIYLFSFEEQAWVNSTTRNSDWDDMIGMGMTEEELIEGGMTPYNIVGGNRLYPGICIQVGFVRKDGRPSYIWK